MSRRQSKETSRIVAGKTHKYALIPFESVEIKEGRTITKASYELGIKRGNSTWEFVCGDNLGQETFNEIFPDFPKEIDLPKVERIVKKPQADVKQILATYRTGVTTYGQFTNDAGISFRLPDQATNHPPGSPFSGTAVPTTVATSGWRVYSHQSHFVFSFPNVLNQETFVVGDWDGVLSSLTFSNGILSDIGPAK